VDHRVSDLLRVPPLDDTFRLAHVETRSTPGTSAGKKKARKQLFELGAELKDLQERLWAEGRTGGRRRVLVVLQGMDTSGKGGAVKNVVGHVNPGGVRITGFGAPTEEELRHDFLWRIEKALPPCGAIGVFDRSHYEDVLIARVHDLVPPAEWETRYDRINEWESRLVDDGVVLLKVMFHISFDYQRERLLRRLDDPSKHWKLDPSDIDERKHWDDYQHAYDVALQRCSTAAAPWYVVPADRKWYRNWALSRLLVEAMRDLDLQWPARPDLDLEQMRRALGG
jgi:PPK2 family polyphosphate:nucleotide phosphotransferase